jgi:hypothetical protein
VAWHIALEWRRALGPAGTGEADVDARDEIVVDVVEKIDRERAVRIDMISFTFEAVVRMPR